MTNRDWENDPVPYPYASAWRQWLVPLAVGVAFIAFAILRPPRACGPGACALPTRAPGVSEVNAGQGMGQPITDTSQAPVADTPGRIAVLYLHGTTRCETCLEIERIAQKTVHDAFADAVAAGTITWRSVDYDLPENVEYDRVFRPPCPSLVLAAVSADGGFGQFKILERTWDLIHEGPDAVDDYVREELQRSLAVGIATASEQKPDDPGGRQ